jgi:3-hydroxybutyryl-CoA dehydrogenase
MVEIRKVAVLGAGTMGSGISQLLAQAGFQVVMTDLEDKFLQRGFNTIKESLGILVQKGKITLEQADKILARIGGSLDLNEAASEADLVIEAIPEDIDLKKQVFKSLDEVCPRHTVLATNTSTISITAIASVTSRPDRVIGIHFAHPVPVMKGVEIIRGLHTSENTFQTAKELVGMLGKEYWMSKDSPGFVGNRLLSLFINEAFNLLHSGIASAEDIDKGIRLALGHPMGPLELADFAGLDVVLASLEYLHKELGEKYSPSPLLKQLVAAGYYGRKTGRGVYKYG